MFFIIILYFYAVSYAQEDSAGDKIFKRQEAPLDLEPIVITKSRSYLLHPYPLDSDALKNSPYDSPVEALSFLPLDLQSRSPKSGIQTDFSLRGSNFQGVLMLLDGQRINDPQTAHHNADIPLTKEDIRRIEVTPGASSSLFGPDAIGGAINMIVKKPQDKKIVLELKGGRYQSKSALLSVSDKIDNLGVRLSLENQDSRGFRYDTDFKKFTATLNSSLDITDGEFNIQAGYQEKQFGAYDFYTPGLGYPSEEWTKTYLCSAGLNLDKAGFMIKPNMLWRRHYDKFMLDKTQVRSNYLNHHHTDIYTPNIYLQKEAGILGKLGLGLEYGEEWINSTNLGKHTRRHKSLFADENKELNDQLSLGLSFRSDDFDSFGWVYTGSASFRYKISERDSLRFGASRNMRIPSFTELYYSDPTTLGNTDLSAEKSLNYEVGYDYKKEKLSAGLTFFLRQESDSIDWIKREPSQAKWQVENITEADVVGLESYLRLKISERVTVDSNYSYINRHADDRGYLYKYGPNYIKHLVNTALTFNLPFGVQTLGLTYKKKPSRRGWLLLNTRLCHNLPKNSQIFLEITNLLNVEYQEIEGIPQPGRWIEGGLRVEW
ncbi:MAG: TonB-dependent receptor [Candidatus Omnitrophica bacterium]|nr:TonB-dependent receptor [Candidatus Omnitrophota bacterium]MDD5592213.1 TonB-dependent receptor [Candidatus Omnitrophota bacterium]